MMRKNVKSTVLIFLLIFSMSSILGTNPAVAYFDGELEWRVELEVELEYEITVLEYKGANSMPIEVNGVNIGELRQGDFLYVDPYVLPDLSTDQVGVETALRATNAIPGEDTWVHWYYYNTTIDIGNEHSDFLPFFWPVMPAPTNESKWCDWTEVWSASDNGFGANCKEDYRHVNLYSFGQDPAANPNNITDVHVIWDYDGYMGDYNINATDKDGFAYRMELRFRGFEGDTGGDWDPDGWGLYWGIGEGTMVAYDIATNASEGVPLGDSRAHEEGWEPQVWMEDGDLLIYNIDHLSDLYTGLNWSGSAMTRHNSMSYLYDWMDENSTFPNAYMPVVPLGNEQWTGNLTGFLSEDGGTVTIVGDTLTTEYPGNGAEHGYMNGTWDLTTGLQQSMYLELDYGSGPTWVSLDFVYEFYSGEPDLDERWVSERYIIDHMQNGTRDYIEFTEMRDRDGNPTDDFRIYEGDIMKVQGWYGTWEEDYGEGHIDYKDGFIWEARTTSGYQAYIQQQMRPPGMDFDGPPMLYWMIPVSSSVHDSASWFDELEDLYLQLGYNVYNTAEQFGVGANLGEMNFTVNWNKADGVMEYYTIIANIEGDTAIWEMHRGLQMPEDNLEFGVAEGTSMAYQFTEVTGNLPFGEPGSSAYNIQLNDIMNVTFTKLDLTDGPIVFVDMAIGATIQENVSMSMQEPGFEFTSFEDEYGGGGPPLLYFAIPTGDAAWWTWVVDIYTEVGYIASQTADTITVGILRDGMNISVTWSKNTGLMETYSYDGPSFEDGSTDTVSFSVVRISENVVDPTTSTSDGDDGPGLDIPFDPTGLVALPLLAFVTNVVYRRRKK